MGMDVFGKNAASKTGEYFRNNVWWWRPLAAYACKVAPDVTAKCKYWQSNDGDGLNAQDSRKLADLLQEEIDSGRCDAHGLQYTLELEQMPDESCSLCSGTGIRCDGVGIENKFVTKVVPLDAGHRRAGLVGWCNGCNGKGSRRPDDTHYPFSTENVQEFVNFLRECGGFEIC